MMVMMMVGRRMMSLWGSRRMRAVCIGAANWLEGQLAVASAEKSDAGRRLEPKLVQLH